MELLDQRLCRVIASLKECDLALSALRLSLAPLVVTKDWIPG